MELAMKKPHVPIYPTYPPPSPYSPLPRYDEESQSIEPKKSCCMRCFSVYNSYKNRIYIILCCLIVLGCLGIASWQFQIDQDNISNTTGTVTKVWDEECPTISGTYKSVYIAWNFTVDANTYHGSEKVRHCEDDYSLYVVKYPVGSTITVYWSDNPNESSLKKEPNGGLLGVVILLSIISLVAILMLIADLCGLIKKN